MQHVIYIPFLFALGACVGSFLNVVVWRLPRGESLVTPPSHCPKCEKLLKWYDNIPVLGWIKLGGRCRYCKAKIAMRYPIVEAITGALFAFFYVALFVWQWGPTPPIPAPFDRVEAGLYTHVRLVFTSDWPIYALEMALVSALLAASLIDFELFIIPARIPWLMAAAAVIFHAALDHPSMAGALSLVNADSQPSMANALAAGGAVGLLISASLWAVGWMPLSFPSGEPMLEVDREALAKEIAAARRQGRAADESMQLPPSYTPRQIRAEIRKEMLFLLPPLALGIAWTLITVRVAPVGAWWNGIARHDWVSGLLGALLGGMVGAGAVWITRIIGTYGFGRVAMGLGDVDLMFAVGATLGGGAAVAAFFLAPFFGILLAIYLLLTGSKREIPYGPYLSLASGFVILFYQQIANYLGAGGAGLVVVMQGLFGIH